MESFKWKYVKLYDNFVYGEIEINYVENVKRFLLNDVFTSNVKYINK